MTWAEFYSDRIGNRYFDYFCEKYEDFLDIILMHTPSRYHGIGEFGCGIGNTTKFLLAETDQIHYCYDNDHEMIELARKNLDHHPETLVHHHDIREPMIRRYDMIHSHGVLEHFDDHEIIRILSNYGNMTNVQVHYVPVDGYKEPSFGDERLLTVDDWRRLTSHLNTTLIPFNDHDLCIVVEPEN